MTIASTGNKITDQNARASARHQREEEALKNRARKSGKSGKSGSRHARAGRAAIKSSRGRGVTAKKQKSGKGAMGLLNYAMDKEDAKLILSNCGTSKNEIIADLRLAASMRPDAKKPFSHLTFSLPPTTKINDQKWIEITDFVREQLDLDDSFPFAAIRHFDTDHDHIHIIYSRVSMEGKIHNEAFIGLRLAALEDAIEDRFDLPLTPRPADPAPRLQKNEIEKALRTKIQPVRMQLASIVKAAAEGKPSAVNFVQRCAAQGVIVRPNIATTGRLNGFSFSLISDPAQVEFKGSQIGASWSNLQKNGVTYEQNRDATALTNLAAAVTNGQRTIEPPAPEVPSASSSKQSKRYEVAKPAPATRPAPTADRRDEEAPVISDSRRKLLELRARFDRRALFFKQLRAKLENSTQAAQRLAEALKPEQTELEIAASFIKQEKWSEESRELIKQLNLSTSQIAEILQPFRAQLKTEDYYKLRMLDAIKNAPEPAPAPVTATDLPTF